MSKKLLKDTMFYGGADVVLKIISFFTFPILANLLKLDDFGIITLAGTFAGFIGMFMNLGINNAVQRFYFAPEVLESERPKLISSALWSLSLWSIILCTLAALFTWPLSKILLQRYQMPWSYLALSIFAMVPNQIITFCNDVIRLHFKPINFLLLSFIKNLVAIVAGILVLKFTNYGIQGYLWVSFLAPTIFIPLAIYFIKKEIVFRLNIKWAKKIIAFGYPFVFAGIAYWLFGSMDRWLLAEFSNNEQIGLYSVAFKLGSLVLFINSAFGQAWSPMAIKMINENPDTYQTQFAEILNIYYWFVIALGVGLSLFVKEFYMLTTPKEYWLATNVSIFLIIGLVINCTTQITAVGISISKKTKIFTKVAWITALINLILNLMMIPKFGASGSAIATSITYLVLTILYIYYTQKLNPLPFNYKKLALATIVLLVMCIISVYLNNLTIKFIFIIKLMVAVAFAVLVLLINKNLILQRLNKNKTIAS
jgi:O-antigen/teichoic acid export membrane protein